MKPIPTIPLNNGDRVPALGQGTWNMGESAARAADEVRALQHGIELGMTLIDTAEMYGDGGAEKVVGKAIAGRRDEVYLVSKVLPFNASRAGTVKACEASLKRLRVERIDLYLLHWRGTHPFAATIEAMETLIDQGKIGAWGVSNLDLDDMQELLEQDNGHHVQVNQVLYNLSRRGIEFDLRPFAVEQNIALMAYSPIEQGRILKDAALVAVAERHGVTPAQVALAWTLRHPGMISIPKASTVQHVQDNRACLDVTLDATDLAGLDRAFAPPKKRRPLEML
ncbi:aldo/keto reductase [Herbaspirillum lusitanum]|uniref:aldo/keto reductase n=2 Tax=Herbaspirillum lusitanum TaxID=213312 RepID=UPI0022386A23|nr:aldo/keto reductase [Herbaspirillum lusitanum]MCW5300644.1 aldo/keto reductase [Herbaspirillum lusitanum]